MKKKKTALVLSGGGSRGSYEIGVWKALRELKIKPDIVVGTSVGAINGAMIALGKFTEAETLWQQLNTHEIFDITPSKNTSEGSFWGIPMEEAYGYAKEIIKNGGAGSEGMLSLLNSNIDEKRLRRLKVEYGLVTSKIITKGRGRVPQLESTKIFKEDIPKGKLTEYILASASCFPAAQICKIDEEKFIDGGYSDNLPIAMALEKEAEMVIAVDLRAIGQIDKKSLAEAENTTDFRHIYSHFDLGNFLSFNPEVSKQNIRYGYLDGLKAFAKLDGIMYAFAKKSIPKEEIEIADNTANIFGAQTTEIYTEKTLLDELKMKVLDAQVALHKKPINLSQVGSKIDQKILIVAIAEDLRDNGENSKYTNIIAEKVLSKDIEIAKYILSKNLLEK